MVKRLILGLFVLLLVGSVSALDISITNPSSGNFDRSISSLDWTHDGGNMSVCWYDLGDNVDVIVSCDDLTASVSNLNEGNNSWIIYINDSVVKNSSVDFWVDSIDPVLSLVNPAVSPFSTNVESLTIQSLLVESNPFFDFLGRAVLLKLYYEGSSTPFNTWNMGFDSLTNISQISLESADLFGEGTYQFDLSTSDTVGHKFSVVKEFIVDKTNPVLTISSPVDGADISGNFDISTSSTDDRSGVSSIEITVYADLLSPLPFVPVGDKVCNSSSCDLNINSEVWGDSTYRINVITFDKAGNNDSSSLSVDVDSNPPTVTFSSPVNGSYSKSQVVIISSSDSFSSVVNIKLYDNGTLVKTTSGGSLIYVLIGGNHTVYASSSDSFGNLGLSETRSIIVDLSAPVVDVGSDLFSNKIVSVDATSSDALTGINGYSWSKVSGPGNVVFGSSSLEDSTISVDADGVYIIKLEVTDNVGNVGSDNLTLSWDSIAPSVFLSGGTQVIEVFGVYSELGASANDTFDGDLTSSIVISSNVDVNTLGSYEVNYSVSDISGNVASILRTVDVVDTTIPVVSLNGGNEIVELGGVYSELGAGVSDNYYGSLSALVDSSNIDVNTVGVYNVTYNVFDGSGNNATEVIRTVSVVDTTLPVVVSSSPNNEGFLEDFNVSFSVTDLSFISSCSLFIDSVYDSNVSSIFPVNNMLVSGLSTGSHTWSISCLDSSGNVGSSSSGSFSILSVLTFGVGYSVTDLASEVDISSVMFFITNSFGSINWSSPLDLSSGKNWADYVNLTFNNVNVDSLGASELNGSARVSLYNLSLSSPRILKDGVVCTDCNIISFVNGDLVFDVSGFSSYSADETPVVSSSSGGGGSGSSSRCVSSWTCTEWNVCSEEEQTRTCSLERSECRASEDKPLEVQSCVVEVEDSVSFERVENEDVQEEEDSSNQITGGVVGVLGNVPRWLMAVFVIGMVGIVGLSVYVRKKKV